MSEMRTYTLELTQGERLELLVPEGTPRDDLVQSVCELAGFSNETRLTFTYEGKSLAFSSALPDGSVVGVSAPGAACEDAHASDAAPGPEAAAGASCASGTCTSAHTRIGHASVLPVS